VCVCVCVRVCVGLCVLRECLCDFVEGGGPGLFDAFVTRLTPVSCVCVTGTTRRAPAVRSGCSGQALATRDVRVESRRGRTTQSRRRATAAWRSYSTRRLLRRRPPALLACSCRWRSARRCCRATPGQCRRCAAAELQRQSKTACSCWGHRRRPRAARWATTRCPLAGAGGGVPAWRCRPMRYRRRRRRRRQGKAASRSGIVSGQDCLPQRRCCSWPPRCARPRGHDAP
jgi:hypothetical protein